MKRLLSISLSVATLCLIAGSFAARDARADLPMPPPIGATIDEFTLPDASGAEHSLASLKGKNGTVLIFIATQCPVSNAYNERMEKLAHDYSAKGISVVGINSNMTEPAADVKAHAAAHNLTFVILKDNGNKIADELGATHTPEAYFLDANNKLLYHGRIDDSKNADNVKSSDLRIALDAKLAGKPIEKTTAMAFGCSIKRA
ncbi:MAG TPA: redoxin domain-containing protein [Pyrinomonadaceae bacterium]|nr:redoxin domain-containing protein [Pyrinomonadaceae bacterium]